MISEEHKDLVSAKIVSRIDRTSSMPLFECQASDALIREAGQEHINAMESKSLFLINRVPTLKAILVTYDIESEKEEIKDLGLPGKFANNPIFIQLPNGELLFFTWHSRDHSDSDSNSDSEDFSSDSDFKDAKNDLASKDAINNSDSKDSSNDSGSEDSNNDSISEESYNKSDSEESSSSYDSKEFSDILETKYFNDDLAYRFVKLPYEPDPSKIIAAIYFNKNVYCFYENDSFRYDLDKKTWKRFAPMPVSYWNYYSSVIFNRKIIIFGIFDYLMYSIDIESYSILPHKSRKVVKKILLSTEIRLYLIECKNGSVYESEVGNEYDWKIIGNSIIEEENPEQFFCAYHNGDFYISIYYACENSRGYFKFDLNRKVLIEKSSHFKYSAVKKIGENIKAIECWNKKIEIHSDDAIAYSKQKHSLYYLVRFFNKIRDYADDCESLRDTRDQDELDYIGNAYNNLGFKLKAIECFNKAINKKPDYAEAYNSKGIVLGDLERNLEAIECYNEAIKFKPDYADLTIIKEIFLKI